MLLLLLSFGITAVIPEEVNHEFVLDARPEEPKTTRYLLEWFNDNTYKKALHFSTFLCFECATYPESTLSLEVYKHDLIKGQKTVIGKAKLSLANADGSAWELDDISFEKEFQGKGYGRTVIKEIEQTLKPKYITLASVNNSAGFYRKIGFKYLSEELEKKTACQTDPLPDGLMYKEYPENGLINLND